MHVKQEKAWNDVPHLFFLYEDYLLCRNQQFVSFERPEGDKGAKRLILSPWTTGFNHLPSNGGMDDQDYETMQIFKAFLQGENQGQLRNMLR